MDDEPLDRLDAIELAITQVTYAVEDLVNTFNAQVGRAPVFGSVLDQLLAARNLIGTEDGD